MFSFYRGSLDVNQYYFYILDRDFGLCFIKAPGCKAPGCRSSAANSSDDMARSRSPPKPYKHALTTRRGREC